MRTYIYLLLSALAIPLLLTSCIDDEETETSDYCYISGFTLGSLKRTVYSTSADGEQSSYTITFTGGVFPMTIDQRALTITNNDSLPRHTDVSRVITSVSYEGELMWRRSGASDDTYWTAYNSADSLDFTSPLDFAVAATDGSSYRTYKVWLNVHAQKADTTAWTAMEDAACLEGAGERKAVCMGGEIEVLAEEGDGSLVLARYTTAAEGETDGETGGEWQAVTTYGGEGADVTTLTQRDDTLYLSTADGQVICSTDAAVWAPADYPQQEGLRLMGASQTRLYAMLDGSLVSSNGGDWQTEQLDDDPSSLPTECVSCFSYQLADGQRRLMLVGMRGEDYGDESCMVWAKSWREGGEEEATWMFYVENATDKRRCPAMEQLNVVAYDEGFSAFGGRSRSGRYEAMDSIFHSVDHGVTWAPYEDNDMDIDPRMQEQARSATYIASTVDDEKYLWVLIDQRVWRGRINRLGFLRQDP